MSAPTVEDCFPLAPMQEGMLFNSLRLPGTGVDVLMGVVELREDLDVPALAAAWQRVVDHHPSLRSALRWEGVERPQQVVYRDVALPFWTEDWSDLPADGIERDQEREQEQEQRWQELLRSDRSAGFEMSVAPLTRVTLVRFGAQRWRMLWPIHHALVDTLAMLTLLQQVFGSYDAARRGETFELEQSVPQRAYSDWYGALDVSLAEDSWRAWLAGIDGAARLGLAADEPPRGSPPQVHRVQTLALPAPFTADLKAWAKQHGTSLNTILQAAWALLLSRTSGQRRVVFGAVKSCRRSAMPGGDRMIGLALNTLPFVVEVDPDAELLAWLGRLREQWVALREFEHTPLVQLKEWSGVSGRAPLFETVLCFDPMEYAEALAAQDGDWSTRHVDIFGQPDAPLTLNVYGGARLSVRMTYDASRLSDAVVTRLLGQLEALLTNVCASDDARIGALELLPDRERQLLLEEWNAPAPPAPDEACLHHLFEAQAAATPDAVAVVCADEQLSYRELDEQANQLAHALVARGVGPERTVGLCLERSLDAVVTVLAALKAGGAYVPFDPSYPPARLADMARSASLAVLVTHAATRDFAASVAASVATGVTGGDRATPMLCLDAEAPALAAQPTTSPAAAVTPETLAYVLFTSGSTGRPKGVAMPHAPLVNLMRWQLAQSSPRASSRTLQFAPLGFDVSCQELFATLAGGGTLYLVDEATRRDPHELLAFVEAHGITRLFMPFIALQKLVEAALERDVVPATLAEVITAGEQLQVGPGLVEFFRRLPGCTLVNQYGPTECHVVTALTLRGDPGSWPALPPIGRPITGARAYVLDERLELAPVGAPGELCLAGATVGRGYLGDDEQTRAVFLPDPFDPRPGARLYRTGDLARLLEDGNLQFLGRADGQVKLRGYRVELAEVETVLAGHPRVHQAAAVVREDHPGDPRLVAYVVADGVDGVDGADRAGERAEHVGRADNGNHADETDAATLPATLRHFLQERLPGFMLPSAVVVLDALPLTPSGKLDRRALPAPGQRQLTDALVAPRNPLEQDIAGIWTSLLDIDRVGVHDDFFELGGHSLLAMQVVSRLRDSYHVEVPLQRLFEDATIAGLSEHVETLRWAAAGSAGGPTSDDDEVFEL